MSGKNMRPGKATMMRGKGAIIFMRREDLFVVDLNFVGYAEGH